jgi:large subunit ribosomal protein L22
MDLREFRSQKGKEKFFRMNRYEEGAKKPRRVPKSKLRKMYYNVLNKSVFLEEKEPELIEKVKKEMPDLYKEVKVQRAEGRFLRTSARKMGAVLALIRGLRVKKALAILKFTNKKAARLFEKVLKSAIANVENNTEWDLDDVYIAKAVAEQGPTLPRIRPMSMGRVGRIRKRTCHVKVELKEMPRREEL